MISFFCVLLCPSGSWSISGGCPGDTPRVLQCHRGWKGCGPILEEGHLQGDLQAWQRGSWGLQIPQLSARAPPRLTRTREERRRARQTSEDSEKTVTSVKFKVFDVHNGMRRLEVILLGGFVGGCFWSAHLLKTKPPLKCFIETKIFLFNDFYEGSDSRVTQKLTNYGETFIN